MKESSVWTAFRRETDSYLDSHRVENRLEPGFPDVVWTGCGKTGVIELKDWEGDDWVSREQALWLRSWADKGGLGGVLAKKTRGEWLWYPAHTSIDWVRAIQDRKGIAPALVMVYLTESFFHSLLPTSRLRIA